MSVLEPNTNIYSVLYYRYCYTILKLLKKNRVNHLLRFDVYKVCLISSPLLCVLWKVTRTNILYHTQNRCSTNIITCNTFHYSYTSCDRSNEHHFDTKAHARDHKTHTHYTIVYSVYYTLCGWAYFMDIHVFRVIRS